MKATKSKKPRVKSKIRLYQKDFDVGASAEEGLEILPDCCGIGVAEAVKGHTKGEFLAIRYKHENYSEGIGLVLCTTLENQNYAKTNENLRLAGYRRLRVFINPNTSNTIILWAAEPLYAKDVHIIKNKDYEEDWN